MNSITLAVIKINLMQMNLMTHDIYRFNAFNVGITTYWSCCFHIEIMFTMTVMMMMILVLLMKLLFLHVTYIL